MFWWFFAVGVFITGGLLGMTIFRVWSIASNMERLDRGLVPKEPSAWVLGMLVLLMLGSPLYWALVAFAAVLQLSQEAAIGKVLGTIPFVLLSVLLFYFNMSIYSRRDGRYRSDIGDD